MLKMTKLDIKLLVSFLVFVVMGICAAFQYDYIEDKKAFRMSMTWFLLPSIAAGGYYSYYCVFKRGPDQAESRKILGFLALLIFGTLMFLRAFQGYLVFWNGHIGNQTHIGIQGRISKVDIPKRKKLLSKYSIEITDSSGQVIWLDVPGSSYTLGDIFSKQLYKGSLNLIYGQSD